MNYGNEMNKAKLDTYQVYEDGTQVFYFKTFENNMFPGFAIQNEKIIEGKKLNEYIENNQNNKSYSYNYEEHKDKLEKYTILFDENLDEALNNSNKNDFNNVFNNLKKEVINFNQQLKTEEKELDNTINNVLNKKKENIINENINQNELKSLTDSSKLLKKIDYDHDDGDQYWQQYSTLYYNKEKNIYIIKDYNGYNDKTTYSLLTQDELLQNEKETYFKFWSDKDNNIKDINLYNFISNNQPINKKEQISQQMLQELNAAGIKEDMIFRFETSFENEKSIDFYKVYKDKNGDLRLKNYTNDPNYKADYNSFQIGNASELKGINAYAILDSDFAKRALNARWQKNPNNSEKKPFENNDIQIKFTDITKEVENKKYKTSKKNNDIKKQSDNIIINNIPFIIEKNFTKNGKKITNEEYTEEIFKMIKNISKIPSEDINLGTQDKKFLSPLLNQIKKSKDENNIRNIFNEYISKNNNNSKNMQILASIYSKTHQENYKGYKIKRDGHTELERDKNKEAILNDLFPIMTKKNNINYIYNPDTNAIYRGNNQIALQRNNALNNYNAQSYANIDSFNKQRISDTNPYKVKCEFIRKGTDQYGNSVYTLLVPVKAENKSEKKAEKARKKEELRRNIHDAKYLYKYGQIPTYYTSLQPIKEIQPPIIDNPDDIKINTPYPTDKSSTEDKLKYEYENYFKSMFTKTEYNPATDWTQKENKKELYNFANEHPESMEKIANESYQNIAQQARILNNQNINENINEKTNIKNNENIENKEEINTKTHGRKR